MDRQKLFDSFIEFMGRFVQLKAVAALRDGFIMTTPFTICGSVFLLLANLPVPGYGDCMSSLFGKDWTAPLNAVAGGTFSVLALIVVLSITYKYVENEGCDAMMAAILALSTFLILMPPTITTKEGAIVGDIIPKAWAGSNGVITAILIAFFVSCVFCYFEKHHIGIKMPDAVPQGVARAFSALVPGMVFFTTASVLYGLCHYLVPFVLVPLFAMFITWFAISTGFMAPFSAVQVPWTTPPIIAGFLLDGWQGAVIQIVNLVMATAIYFPFLKAQDKIFLKEEQSNEAE